MARVAGELVPNRGLGYSDYYRLLGLHEIPRLFQQVAGQHFLNELKDPNPRWQHWAIKRTKAILQAIHKNRSLLRLQSLLKRQRRKQKCELWTFQAWRSVQPMQTRRKWCEKSHCTVTWNMCKFRLDRIYFICQVHSLHGCSDTKWQLGGATQVQNRNTSCALEHISQPDYKLCRALQTTSLVVQKTKAGREATTWAYMSITTTFFLSVSQSHGTCYDIWHFKFLSCKALCDLSHGTPTASDFGFFPLGWYVPEGPGPPENRTYVMSRLSYILNIDS